MLIVKDIWSSPAGRGANLLVLATDILKIVQPTVMTTAGRGGGGLGCVY